MMNIESLHESYLTECVPRVCLCGRATSVTVKKGDRYGLPINYALCLNCGHVYTKNVLADQRISEFYGSSLYRTMYTGGASPEETIKRKTPARGSTSQLLELTRNVLHVDKGNVLEWGCGGGWNLVPFIDAGYHTIGVDFDAVYVSAGSKLNGLDLRRVEDDTISQLSKTEFNIIILNHVLEHSFDPLSLLMNLRKLCSSGTFLIVGLPTLESMKIWGYSDYFHIAHLDYFCRSSFVRLAAKAGFKCIYEEVPKGLFVLVPAEVRDIKVSRKSVISSAFMIFKSWLNRFAKQQVRRFARITKTENILRSIVRKIRK